MVKNPLKSEINQPSNTAAARSDRQVEDKMELSRLSLFRRPQSSELRAPHAATSYDIHTFSR